MIVVKTNSLYQHYSDFIRSLPENFSTSGTTIYKGRNEVKLFHVQGMDLIVKSFKIPHFVNRIVYGFFRSSKASRAFENEIKLKAAGFNTPESVGYLECKKRGLLTQSFFVSLKSKFSHDFREVSDRFRCKETNNILSGFAEFTAKLHDKNILHKDYTPGNILFEKKEEKYSFELIDTNRMFFGRVRLKKGIKNFDKLYLEDDMFRFLARKYASFRKLNPDICEKLIIQYRKLRTIEVIKY